MSDEKWLSTSESVKLRITELYRKSIRENPSPVNEDLIGKLRHFFYEQCPAKVSQLNEQCQTIYTRQSLQSIANSIDRITSNIPTFNNSEEVEQYRNLYRQQYWPYVANESCTMLLPDGPIPINVKFGEIIDRLLFEVEQFILSLIECRFTLNLMLSPFGAERSFDSKMLASMISNVVNISQLTRSKRIALRRVVRSRAADIVTLNERPQLNDTRHYVEHSETELFNDLSTYAIMLRNNYCLLHQFAVKNATRIDNILKQALKNARYGKGND